MSYQSENSMRALAKRQVQILYFYLNFVHFVEISKKIGLDSLPEENHKKGLGKNRLTFILVIHFEKFGNISAVLRGFYFHPTEITQLIHIVNQSTSFDEMRTFALSRFSFTSAQMFGLTECK